MSHEASGLNASTVTTVQATVRRRLLRAAQRRGPLSENDAQAMAEWAHACGFSVDANVRIEIIGRAGLTRLLQYCARPAFALERLREIDARHLVYESVRPGPSISGRQPAADTDGTAQQPGGADFATVPAPARNVGVLEPNAPLRAVVTAPAQLEAEPRLATSVVESAGVADDIDEPHHRKAARLIWAMLTARTS